MIPSLRTLYLSRSEAATFADASAYAARYNAEAEQLNAQEKGRRTEGDTLDDFSIARISSFLKSYGEMQKGEQFVMKEVRARARERIRWVGAFGLMMLALLGAPFSWRSAAGWLSR
jgi:zinc/manganese transport system permease protein